ncbi:MAG TPA: FecR domain-containing protein [Alphaproteobacteria bacterium]|nr:FecR domain-containing protein [Alphaproteobacteria bacterium]
MTRFSNSLRRALAVCALVLPVLSQPALGQEPDPIGTIKTTQGSTVVIRDAKRLPAAVGLALRQGDILETGANGSVGATLRDNGTIALGPNSVLTLDSFVFAPAERKFGFATKVAKGTALFTSGAIAKLAPDSVKIETPTGTIGVRGTRFLVKAEVN